jgi:ribonucleoside-diphosphate reductase alpha chain
LKTLQIVENIKDVVKERYYQPHETTPQQMIRRVADFVASGEAKYGWSKQQIKSLADEYYNTMMARKWLPSSPFLMNAGTKVPMLSACFVVGNVNDDINDIYEAVRRQGLINRAGGGTGFYFGRLREEGSPIKSTGGTSSGVMAFMELFNSNGEVIKQGGRRRSANIGVLKYNHPEIMKFIDYKNDHTKLTNFNISVLVDDEFMHKVEANEEYDLITPNGNHVVGRLNARDVFMKIIENNWKSGEPALLFSDAINRNNPMREYLGDIQCTNP